MADIDLLNQIIDLKIERAVAAVMGKVNELGMAHNQLTNEVVPPLVADLNKRKAEGEKSLESELAQVREQLRVTHLENERLRAEAGE